jgi:serine/threonine-protein kinase
MGEVYRARDTRLGRNVALKLLPDVFAADAERLGRFEREAKLLASLNHPSIGAIYGLERDGDSSVLVLELIGGEDLAKRLRKGPLSVKEATRAALQIAEALEYAHERGVIHRDLKPGNVVVSPDGDVKVLDFGLAKALDTDADSGDDADLSKSPTLIANGTAHGMILGTAAYMSPEQARGRAIDRRADVFAFGCLLYEILTGKQCFSGETVSDTLASVLKSDPDWSGLPEDTPAAILRLMERCLEKDPKRRLRDIGEARVALEDVADGRHLTTSLEAPDEAPPTKRTGERIAWIAAVLAVAVVAAAAAWALRPSQPEPLLRKYVLSMRTPDDKPAVNPIISPDGSRIAFQAGGKLWVQDLDQLDPRPLAETSATAVNPFWSPDGHYIGYAENKRLMKVSVASGVATKICDTPSMFGGGGGATWSGDGRIVFSYGSSGLYEVPAGGGDPRSLLEPDPELESDFHQPGFLPGGSAVMFVQHRLRHGPDTLQLLRNGERTTLVQFEGTGIWDPFYSPTGHILYHRVGDNGGVWALPFSLSNMEPSGNPFLLTADASVPSAAAGETMSFMRGNIAVQGQLVWVDRSGTVLEAVSDKLGIIQAVSLSPDGRKAAVSVTESGNRDVWIIDLERKTKSRLTFANTFETMPAWTPDGKSVVYRDIDENVVFIKASDGTGDAVQLVEGSHPTVTPDGAYLLFDKTTDSKGSDLCYAPLNGDGEPVFFVQSPGDETYPVASPDGDYLLYRSDESGTDEIYLIRFPLADGKWQVSTGGGTWPRWNRTGDRIYYRENSALMEVTVELGETVRLGTPQKLFVLESANLQAWGWNVFDVAPDGERFLFVQGQSNQDEYEGVVIVKNWLREFREGR